MMRDHNVAGAAMAGFLLLGVPIVDILLGNGFGGVHAVLGLTGIALLVMALVAPEEA